MLTPFRVNLSKDDMYQCGRVAVWSTMLDTAIEVSIWLLLDLPPWSVRASTASSPTPGRNTRNCCRVRRRGAGGPKATAQRLDTPSPLGAFMGGLTHGMTTTGPQSAGSYRSEVGEPPWKNICISSSVTFPSLFIDRLEDFGMGRLEFLKR